MTCFTIRKAVYFGFVYVLYSWLNSKIYRVHEAGVIIVTGASSGIGYDAALGLDKEGYHILAGVRNEKAAAKLRKNGSPRLQPIILDVTSEENILNSLTLADEIYEKNNSLPLVGIVNNAGVSKDLPWEFMTKETIDFTMDINFKGVALLTIHSIPRLKRSQGRIITVGSAAGKIPNAGQGIYSASKHAVEALSDTLRRELNEFGVSVSLVDPGCIQADIFKKSLMGSDPRMKLPKEQQDMYKWHFQKRDNDLIMCEHTAESPSSTSTIDIVHAMKSPYPKTRYFPGGYMGAPIYLVVWLFWITPDRIMDLMVTIPADKIFAVFMPLAEATT